MQIVETSDSDLPNPIHIGLICDIFLLALKESFCHNWDKR